MPRAQPVHSLTRPPTTPNHAAHRGCLQHKMRPLLPAWLLVAALQFSAALSPGDCAIVRFRSKSANEYSVLLLADLPQAETIWITDQGWTGSALLSESDDGYASYTAIAPQMAGTILTQAAFTDASDEIELENDDQLLVFQGTSANPSFLCAIDWGDDGWLPSNADGEKDSFLPAELTEGDSAVWVGNYRNGVVTSGGTGTPAVNETRRHSGSTCRKPLSLAASRMALAELRATINTASAWSLTSSNSNPADPPTFTVLSVPSLPPVQPPSAPRFYTIGTGATPQTGCCRKSGGADPSSSNSYPGSIGACEVACLESAACTAFEYG
eukprot:5729105-Prymnesium_polylepis.1